MANKFYGPSNLVDINHVEGLPAALTALQNATGGYYVSIGIDDDGRPYYINPPISVPPSGSTTTTPVYIQATQPSGTLYTWWDTSQPNLTLWIEDGT